MFIKGKIEGTRRQGMRSKQLRDDLEEKSRYWKLKEEALGYLFPENLLLMGLWTSFQTDYAMTA
jgi:hypothetical protein